MTALPPNGTKKASKRAGEAIKRLRDLRNMQKAIEAQIDDARRDVDRFLAKAPAFRLQAADLLAQRVERRTVTYNASALDVLAENRPDLRDLLLPHRRETVASFVMVTQAEPKAETAPEPALA